MDPLNAMRKAERLFADLDAADQQDVLDRLELPSPHTSLQAMAEIERKYEALGEDDQEYLLRRLRKVAADAAEESARVLAETADYDYDGDRELVERAGG